MIKLKSSLKQIIELIFFPWFSPAPLLCLSQARTWISSIICHGLFCVQWVKVRGDLNVTYLYVHSFKALICIQAHVHAFLLPVNTVHVYTTDIVQRCLKKYLAKIKNKFLSPYPTDPVKIGRLNFFYWKFAVNFFFPFRSKFALLKIPYFRFVSPKDRYFCITKHIFVVKKKSLPTYPLPKLWSG
jgi:hypothetical protein